MNRQKKEPSSSIRPTAQDLEEHKKLHRPGSTLRDVMMTAEFRVTPVEDHSLLKTAPIVGVAAVIGSIIPLLPSLGLPPLWAMCGSITAARSSVFIVGAYKARVTVGEWWKACLQMLIIGLVTALVSYGIGPLIR